MLLQGEEDGYVPAGVVEFSYEHGSTTYRSVERHEGHETGG